MENDLGNVEKKLIQSERSSDQGETQFLEEVVDIDKVGLTNEQKIEQDIFLRQFTEFLPSKNHKSLVQDYEFRLFQNVKLNSNFHQDIHLFYKDQCQYSEKIKNKIFIKLKDLHYSMNHLSMTTKFFQSYTSYQNFCVSAQMILNNQNCQHPPYQIFEHVILFNILKTHRILFLQNLLVKFKYFSLIRRREILNIAVNRFITDIKKESKFIPYVDNSKDRIIKELTRLSQQLGIKFDVYLHDGQHFIYECETLLSEYQRIHFTFNLIKDINNNPSELIDCINNKFMETSPKDELIVEAFDNIINPNDRYKIVVFNAINNRSFPTDQIQALINLRFCRNRQLLLELERSIKKLFKYRALIYENFDINETESEELLCNKYISFIIEQILIFTSAIYIKSDKKGDLDPFIENSLDKQLRYTKSKVKILSIFVEISKHSNSIELKELTDQIIDKKPNLIFKGNSFYELFEIQIEILEIIGKTISILLNLQILNERQMTSFYGSFYEPFQFGTFYSNESEGEFNTSKFEVYLNLDKILNFFSIAKKTVNDICSTMSIKSIEYSNYIELAVWSQLLNEIDQRPEVALFGSDFSNVHFNLPLSKEVEGLINCRILDDPLFLKKFLSEKVEGKSNEFKSEFTRNLSSFVLLATKLRKLIYRTDLFLPLYIRQHNESNFAFGSTEKIEFMSKISLDFGDYSQIKERCLNGNFSDIIELINVQRRYNIVLRIAIQFNNFRSDNYCLSFLFNIPSKDNLFYITKSETKNAKFFQEASKKFFVDVDSITNQDFSTVFFEISDQLNYSDSTKLIPQIKKYLNRIELASLTNFERIILHDFHQFDHFTFKGQFYQPNSDSIDYFIVPNMSQCLSLDCDLTQFDKIIKFVSNRLKLINFVRFNSFLNQSNKRAFDLLLNHQMTWQSTFFSRLHSNEKLSLDDSIRTFQSEILFETSQFELSILQLAQKVFLTKRACHLQGKAKPTNLSLITDDEVRDFWKKINIEFLNDINHSNPLFSLISIERYNPKYLSNFNLAISDKMRVELLERMKEIQAKVYRNVIFDSIQNYSIESSLFVKNELVNELLKFAFLRLHNKAPFNELNIVSIVDITRREYKETMPFYSSNVAFITGQQSSTDYSRGVDGGILRCSIQLASDSIKKFIEKSQKDENYRNSVKVNEQIEAFNSIDSPLKPECYAKKKNKLNFQKMEPYNPNPIDAQRQFDQEMKYARSKIIKMIVDALDSNKKEKQLTFNSNSLISKLIPVSNALFDLVNKSRIQILKTWPSYTEKMKSVTFGCCEQDSLLSMFVNSFIKRYNMELNYRLSEKIQSDYLKLCCLRNALKRINHEQTAYDDEITKQIRNEFVEKLSEINKEKQEVLKKFPIVHNRYFSQLENVISKHSEKVDLNDDDRKLNDQKVESKKRNHFKSLDISPSRPNHSQTLKDDPSVHFTSPKNPRLKMNSQRQFKRMDTQDPLFQSKNDIPTFSQKRQTNSVTSQRSMDLLTFIHKSNSKSANLDAQKKKYQKVDDDIGDLKKTIIKLRILKCLFKIGSLIHYRKSMNKMTNERKEESMLLWLNRKSFEEDTRELKDDISNCFKRLSEFEKQSENLKQELEAQKLITTKLAHWKELSLRSSDQILKQIGVYQKGPNVEVCKLLKKLEEKRDELDSLNLEAEEFENQLINKVRQPMEEISRIRKVAQRQQYENLRMKENITKENALISNKILNLEAENNKLKSSNEKLRMQIEQIEYQISQVPPVKIEATKELFELNPPPTTRRLKTSNMIQRRGKTTLPTKSPYAKIGYRSIKRPRL